MSDIMGVSSSDPLPTDCTRARTMDGQPAEANHQSSSNESLYNKLMENVDRTGHRVSIAAIGGLAFGASFATLRGSPILASSMSSAVSCTLLATACFGSERLFYAIIPRPFPWSILQGKEDILSHTLGGMLGGACVGWLYRGRPLSGGLMFTPLMVGVAFAERRLNQHRLERIECLLSQLEKK